METKTPIIKMSLSNKRKGETRSEDFKCAYGVIRSSFNNYGAVYTDCSKDDERVAAAVVTDSHILGKRLTNFASIFTAELNATNLAFSYFKISRNRRFIIFSDSKSVLEAMQNKRFDNPIVLAYVGLYNKSLDNAYCIVLCWIPSHIGTNGYEKADTAAKQALNKQLSPSMVPYTDFKPFIT